MPNQYMTFILCARLLKYAGHRRCYAENRIRTAHLCAQTQTLSNKQKDSSPSFLGNHTASHVCAIDKLLIPELSWKPFSGRGLQIGCLTHPRAFLETMPQTMAKCMIKSHIATLMSPIFHSTNPCAESELYPIATQTPCCVTQHVEPLQKFIISSDILFIDWTIRENSNSETK